LPVVALCVILGVVSYWKGVFDAYGSLTAALMGLVVGFAAGMGWLLLMVLFVLLGYGSTRYRFDFKREKDVGEGRWGRRDAVNVLANGGVPVLLAVAYWHPASEPQLVAAGFVASVASITADTLSSEVGVLSRSRPRLITSFREVAPGTDGGISLLGELAGVAGVGVIVLASVILGILPPAHAMAGGVAGGIVGYHVDSLLGAVFERRGYMGNASVNYISTLAAAVVGIGAVALL